MIDAGKLDQVVTVQTPTETRSASGAVTVSWATFATKRASIQPKDGAERYTGFRFSVEYDDMVQMRGGHAITEKMRITHTDGRKWDIVAIEAADGKLPVNSGELMLACKRGQRQGS